MAARGLDAAEQIFSLTDGISPIRLGGLPNAKETGQAS
jgi:hypothetical protein